MEAGKQISLARLNQDKGKEIGDAEILGDGVSDWFSRLKLTSEERKVLTVDDDVEDNLAFLDRAIVGKILSSSVLNIETIMSALYPAWGNPKGLIARSVGENLFIAEFGSKQDMERVLNGSPWSMNKRAVLIKRFDPNQRPADIRFNQLPIWVRIMNLPLGLMNDKWGSQLAGMVGEVEQLETDEQGRAWGPYLRAKVVIDVSKPLRRCVFSARRQAHELYDVQYENLLFFCFSCGIIGHSSIECPNPVERDDRGLMPYSEKLRVSNDKKKFLVDEKYRNSLSSNGCPRNTNMNNKHVGIDARTTKHSTEGFQNDFESRNDALTKSTVGMVKQATSENDQMDLQNKKRKQPCMNNIESDTNSGQLMYQGSWNELAMVP